MKPRILRRAFFSLNQPARPRTTLLQSKRSYVGTAYTKGTHKALFDKSKHLSPLNGTVFLQLNVLERLYDAKNNSASSELVRELFYLQNDQLRATNNKSNLGYSLTPTLIAIIMHHLNAGTFDSPATRTELCAKWKKIHKLKTDSTLRNNKINKLLDLISDSQKECSTIYPNHMTKNILLGFLCHKAEKRAELTEDYLKTLDQLSPVIEDSKLLGTQEEFNDEDIEKGKNFFQHTSQIKESTLKSNHENAVAALVMTDFLEKVMYSMCSYEDNPSVPNCVEAAFQNLINILLKKGNRFDFSILPATLKPHKKLRDFYKMQDYKITGVNNSEVGKAFMHMVSDLPFIRYKRVNHELKASETPHNFPRLMGYLFLGYPITSFKELSEQFSDENRKVNFSLLDVYDAIKIEITPRAEKTLEITFNFSGHLGAISAPQVFGGFLNGREFIHVASDCEPLLAALLYQKKLSYCILTYQTKVTLSDINTLLTYYSPRVNDTFTFFETIASYIEQFPVLKSTVLEFAKLHGIDLTAAMCTAIRRGNTALIQALFRIGLDPNVQTPAGDTLLHLAIFPYREPNPEIIRLLLDKGANPNTKETINNRTVLHYPTKYPDITKLLLERGANPNAQDCNKKTPLHYADSPEVVICLLKHGATIDMKDLNGQTPLGLAIQEAINVSDHAILKNVHKIIKIYLDAGSDIKLVRGYGAREKMHVNIAMNPGAKIPVEEPKKKFNAAAFVSVVSVGLSLFYYASKNRSAIVSTAEVTQNTTPNI